MKKKMFAVILASVLSAALLAGCGGSSSGSQGAKEETAPVEDNVITIAATPIPHAEILEKVKPVLEAEGIELKVVVYNDYVQPNEVVYSGEMDANYFQHIPYLESYNEEHGYDLVNAGGIHYEPLGLYPGTKSGLGGMKDGDVIAIPNDTTNEARALLLLQDNGIIKLKEGAGLTATVNDIESMAFDLKIEEMEAAQIPHVISEVSYVVLNGNYAIEAGYNLEDDAIVYEMSDSEAAETYVNVIAVKAGHENDENIKILVEALRSPSIVKFINETYNGAVVPFIVK
ncbi:MAG: MetQ/NlpA family ABC transporter substrate-binding protein [Lachnospiraceae bacterium]|nr:MetQ/NlpA family ABC transporter substrate-binding protein [Lachnospiraceae bacterium]MBQ4304727.1 MetQ/NlpA family ABC transporter substrate-binding protein [Lachnospiraceae bacterium]MBQ5361205.1 MetQ/NlpA family ABC transporter substrate-binding protein [Lachnospiraceae bacterium]